MKYAVGPYCVLRTCSHKKIWYNKKYENRIQSNKLSKRSDGRTEGKIEEFFPSGNKSV